MSNRQLKAYMSDTKFHNYCWDLDAYLYPTKSETTTMIRLSQMAGNYKNDLFRNHAERPESSDSRGSKRTSRSFDPEICSEYCYMTLVRILALKSQHSGNLKKQLKYGFIWGEDKKNCNKIICTGDITYYVDEVAEMEILDIDDPKLLYKKTANRLYDEVKSLLD